MTGVRRALTLLVVLFQPVLAPCVFAQQDDDDPVEFYLESRNLDTVLLRHLEHRFQTADPNDRQPIAVQLADVYVRLLKSSPDRPAPLRERAETLLSYLPPAEGAELRIELARLTYLFAERGAELRRLGLVEPEQDAEIESVFRELLATFNMLAQTTDNKVQRLERRENRGDLDPTLAPALEEARRHRSLAHYYAGWCSYYIAYLDGSDSYANNALRHFGWLLNARKDAPATLDRMPDNLLHYEHIARAAVGCALANSLLGDDTQAMQWLARVERADDAPASVLGQMMLRRITILADARRWNDLERLIRRARNSDRSGLGDNIQPLPEPAAKLLVVEALRADQRSELQLIQTLAQAAIADLVTHNQAPFVLTLVQKYGTSAIGDTGFVVHFVRGMNEYEIARDLHAGSEPDPDAPALDAQTIARYRAAERLFDAALDQPDADLFAPQRARVATLRGYCAYYAGEPARASDHFARAHQLAIDQREAEQALWLAILALDELEGDPRDLAQGRRDELVAIFLRSFPESRRAPKLLLERATAGDLEPQEAIKILLSVEPESPVFLPARRYAASLLYKQTRRTRGRELRFEVLRFLDVADGILHHDRRLALSETGPDQQQAAQRVVTLSRQLLDAMLAVEKPDTDRAREILSLLRTVADNADAPLVRHRSELLYRRLQIAIADADHQAARNLHDQLVALAPDPYANTADLLMFRTIRSLLAAETDEDNARELDEQIISIGSRLIDAGGRESFLPPTDETSLAVYLAVAESAYRLWEETRSGAMRDLALKADTAVLAVDPRAAPVLYRLAHTADGAGDHQTAADCWRVILAAHTPPQEPWFEAKYHTIRILALTDKPAARKLLDQHEALFPQLAPVSWRQQYIELDLQLPENPPETTP